MTGEPMAVLGWSNEHGGCSYCDRGISADPDERTVFRVLRVVARKGSGLEVRFCRRCAKVIGLRWPK